MKKTIFLLFVIIIFFVNACSSKTTNILHISLDTAKCNVFSMGDCLTPFPTNQFLSPTTDSTYVNLPANAFAKTTGGIPFPVNEFKIFDGFSPASQIIVMLNGTINENENFPDIFHPARSTEPTSLIQLVSTKTWKRVPLFAEGDSRSYEKFVLLIHPLIRLDPETTYLVILKSGITTNGTSPPPFRALRDKIPTDSQYVEKIRSKYEYYFSQLTRVSLSRSQIFLMWDFTTGSDKTIIWKNIGRIVDLVGQIFMERFKNNIPPFEFEVTQERNFPDGGSGDFLLRQVSGTISVPWLLIKNDSRIKRSADGGVGVSNFTWKNIPFKLNIPRCVTESTKIGLIIFGHGLGGSLNSLDDYMLRKDAEDWCSVEIATNWIGADYQGMERTIENALVLKEHPFYGLISMAENLLQGHLDFLALTLNAYDILLEAYPDFPTRVTLVPFYYGVSNGGIQGGTFAATSQFLINIIRNKACRYSEPPLQKLIENPYLSALMDGLPDALVVNGAVWSILFQRYNNWNYFEGLFMLKIPDAFEITKMVVLAQMFYDLVDPITFAPYYEFGPFACLTNSVPEKFKESILPPHCCPTPNWILSQESIGDASVSNITTEIWARTAHLPGLAKLIDNPYGIEEKKGPLSSALTQWDGHPRPLPPPKNSPLGKEQITDVYCGNNPVPAHTVPFCLDKAREQVRRFIFEKEIFQLCSGGVCDPE